MLLDCRVKLNLLSTKLREINWNEMVSFRQCLKRYQNPNDPTLVRLCKTMSTFFNLKICFMKYYQLVNEWITLDCTSTKLIAIIKFGDWFEMCVCVCAAFKEWYK